MVKNVKDQDENPVEEEQKDYSLGEGEKIKVNIKVKTKGRTTEATGSAGSKSGGGDGGFDMGFLGAPPSSSRAKSSTKSQSNNSLF